MRYLLMLVLLVSVSAAPFYNQLFQTDQMMVNQRPDQQSHQFIMSQMMEQQMMEQIIEQSQRNLLQQQLIAMQQASPYVLHGPIKPTLPLQPILLLLPNTKSTDRIENLNENDQLHTKYSQDPDSVTIDAENPNFADGLPERAMVILPNGQRYIIGQIISAIPFLPFEVNVPDTISWMYNGIAGIIGGIGQRLPFRPKPTTTTTETPAEMPTPEATEPSQANRLSFLQKLMRKKNVGMPVLMMPVAQAVPIQVPIEV